MIKGSPATSRQLLSRDIAADLAVIGGGIAGVCCAVTAARAGLKVALVHDRPVLGGNASSEVRLWILGATSHMGNNNRWAREGGVMDEILVENMFRNPEGNPLILDTILLEMVSSDQNIQLFLNTAVFEVEKSSEDSIASVTAFCSQNSTSYRVSARFFADASGDGIVGFLAGAAFRIGAEGRQEFGELFAPERPSSELLGHSIYFYSKDTGRPVKFHPPAYALEDITKIPRWRDIKIGDYGCRLWWLEWGGQLDTIHDSETIKWELWKVAYGVWNHIKNSGQFADAATHTLEWVGTIPGKRESRRFEGDYMLIQQDIVEQRQHFDAVSFGGWAIDLHPAEGVYSSKAGCTQWHSKGVYQIPYRCLYSRNISNLFLAGRIISSSHIAFGSTRVMATCGHNAQAVGMAAVMCHEEGLSPRDLLEPGRMQELQRRLMREGQYIPGLVLEDPRDLARSAKVTASSELKLRELVPSGESVALSQSLAMMLPVSPGPMPEVEFLVDVHAPTTLVAELRISSKPMNQTPDRVLKTCEIPLPLGNSQRVPISFSFAIDCPRYAFICLRQNDAIAVHLSDQRVTGVLSLCHGVNKAVAKSAIQTPPQGIGVDTFEFWLPKRRPLGKNMAIRINPPLDCFRALNLVSGVDRPASTANAWVADFAHEQPFIRMSWKDPQTIRMIELWFDSDYDHPMESVLMGHPERVMPFCVRDVRIINGAKRLERVSHSTSLSERGHAAEVWQKGRNGNGQPEADLIAQISYNHKSRQVIKLDSAIVSDCIEIYVPAPDVNIPAALFAVRCYA